MRPCKGRRGQRSQQFHENQCELEVESVKRGLGVVIEAVRRKGLLEGP